MELGLYQTQSLKLVMTQELRQAITILQYPTIELAQFIQQQALENPLIDFHEKGLVDRKDHAKQDTHEQDSWYYDEDDEINPIQFIKSEDPSLQAHLVEQLTWMDLTDEDKSIIEYLIYCLDENGYLDCRLECLEEELQIPMTTIEQALSHIQRLEPAGVGARTLSECLILQYDASQLNVPAARTIIEYYLNDFADKKWTHISKALNITMKELKQAEEVICSLNPRPCSAFQKTPSEWIQPEFFIDRNERGELKIRMNEDLVPDLSLNERYFRILQQNTEARPYLEKQLQKYEWLKRSLDQRQQTLHNLGEYLLYAQKGFFEKGYEALRPMTLKEVADHIEVHESTISRAVKNKTIQTPRGTVSLKSLFTSRLDKQNQAEEASSAQVKVQIQRMIEQEKKQKPLSDQKIANALIEEGVEISRRTVAKYREELRIPSSSKRKSIVV